METRIFEGEGDVQLLHLQKFGTFPIKNGRAKFLYYLESLIERLQIEKVVSPHISITIPIIE